MYGRLATATPKGEHYYDFNPKFNLVAIIDKLSTLRGSDFKRRTSNLYSSGKRAIY